MQESEQHKEKRGGMTNMGEIQQIKFEPVSQKAHQGCVMIVGMCPSRQRKKQQTLRAWEGNKTGDLMQKAIKDCENVFLTNVFNTYVYETSETGKKTKAKDISVDTINDGLQDLNEAISTYKPRKIVALGTWVEKQLANVDIKGAKIVKLWHPGFVKRFGKDETVWIKNVQDEINS
jgi:uracil-DNA glycosylase